MKKIDIGQKSKVEIKWDVMPVDYSREKENDIKVKFAAKYGIPKNHIRVTPKFISVNKKGEKVALTNDVVKNIQVPKFQQKLFARYLKERGIDDYDMEMIVDIDNKINSLIDYSIYDKQRRYEIKWVRWSNFMSYGPDNFFDFTKLNGLVLLNGAPQNQSGKSTFCNDLIRFLLFGKVSSRDNNWTLSEVFNYYLPEATEVAVEGCLNIDGEDYIIKRTVTRPPLKKRTVKSKVVQKILYYKLVNDEKLELTDVDNQEGKSTTQTNQIIKEAIGQEKDFDLVICANADNLKSLISLKDTERGRLLSRWIGLLPLEEKDKIAREKFNKDISPKLTMGRYSKEELKVANETLDNTNRAYRIELAKTIKDRTDSEEKIKNYETEKEKLLLEKKGIDSTLSTIDVRTVEAKINDIITRGKKKRAEKEENVKRFGELKDVVFSENEYKELILRDKKASITLNANRNKVELLNREINALKKGEFCPTCGAKLKDVDNSKSIAIKSGEIKELIAEISVIEATIKELSGQIEKMEVTREKFNEKTKLSLIIDTNTVDIQNLESQYRENKRLLKDLEANKAAIENNNKIDLALNIVNTNLRNEKTYKDSLTESIERMKKEIIVNENTITNNEVLIKNITNEEKLVKNWKIYLELVGKNGISKMVLRNTLPLINGELKRLLADVCDFEVVIGIDDRNDVSFTLIRDGITSPLGCGSGFEQTCAGLALRIVLGNISILPRPSYIIFDEILGGVSDDNYEKMKLLYDRIIKDYSFIFQITHLKAINDWHQHIVNVEKRNNVSKIVNN